MPLSSSASDNYFPLTAALGFPISMPIKEVLRRMHFLQSIRTKEMEYEDIVFTLKDVQREVKSFAKHK